jgi:hypothetical protein
MEPERFLRRLYATAKWRAKRTGMPFNIEVEDLVVPETCPVFGIPLVPTYGTGKRNDGTPSLDRLDNTKGYTKDNIRMISFKANMYKGNMTIADVEALLKYMKGN